MNSRTAPLLRRAVAALVAVVLGVVLGGCAPAPGTKEQVAISPYGTTRSTPDRSDSAQRAKRERAPKGFERYYAQHASWRHCDMMFECATISAPMDWSDPSSEPIRLALERRAATGDRIGSLLVNPGGPGASGTQFVTYTPYIFGKDVLASYDVVGFDPRGVGDSTPVLCDDDKAWDQYTAASFPTTTSGRERLERLDTELGAACAAGTGTLLQHLDTASTVRDMDMIRAVLGERRLDYLGFSYGTRLGALYAAMFPGNVGRMVLDGAVDPTLSPEELAEGQAVGFEHELRAYVADCQSRPGCPLSGSVDDGMEQVGSLLDSLLADPLPTDDPDRPLTQSLGVYGVMYALYSTSLWPTLTSALAAAINGGDGSGLLANADSYNSRNSDGTYADNSGQAFVAITCQEPRETSDPTEMAAEAKRLEELAPTVGKYMAYGGLLCKSWPAPVVTSDADPAAPGAPPIVVVGTTGDPATPYAWAQSLARTLDSGVLLTYDGDGHTAYGSSNECVLQTVGRYLVDDVVPADGTLC